ncbi:Porin-like protein NicP [Pseudomonas reidholzensis]|uniref:Porin-like protein NicP n=1 Tax=Pseudomonas reidholzensis TaxID=1785162 RepID=A0A383RUM4_9PSED|nr:OprD family porin [Pseudomonas reidholzensis]SYX90206.1 Porin-like protein NicP [Pseudomonas reidholzensis]
MKTRNAAFLMLALSTPLMAAPSSPFFTDSGASILLHNYYFDRDYKDPYNPALKQELREWAQGVTFDFKSGYTEGPVGFGLDLHSMTGLKLDSSPDRAGTQLLPLDSKGRAEDNFTTFGGVAKARFAQTKLNTGRMVLTLPVAYSSPGRLLPQTFQGTTLQSQDIQDLTLMAGYLDRIKFRDSSNYENIRVTPQNGRFIDADSSGFSYLGGKYQVAPNFNASYYHATLNDIYRQDYLWLVHDLPIGPGSLKTDFRWVRSGEDGAANGGKVDNDNLGVVFRYSLGGHTFSTGYMALYGDTAQPYMGRSEPSPTVEGAIATDFLNAKERTWQVRWDYNFAVQGIPGLTAMLWHMRGDNIELPERMGGSGLYERESQAQVAYVIQSGALQGLGIKVRHAWYRNDFTQAATFRDNNDLRVNIVYSWKLW